MRHFIPNERTNVSVHVRAMGQLICVDRFQLTIDEQFVALQKKTAVET